MDEIIYNIYINQRKDSMKQKDLIIGKNNVVLAIAEKNIVDLFQNELQDNDNSANDLVEKLDEIVKYVYWEGYLSGLSGATTYISKDVDRQQIFKAIEKLGDE